MYRKVIVSRGVRWGHSRRERRRGLLQDLTEDRPVSTTTAGIQTTHPFWPGRVGAAVVLIIALLLLVTGELALPGLTDLAIAAMLLGCGMAAVGRNSGRRPTRLPASQRLPALDAQEQVRRHVRLLERRRHRCLETLVEVQHCAAAERLAGRPVDRLESAASALSAAVTAFDAGIAREQATGLALRVTRWIDRLPSLVEGLERLDLGAYRHRMERLEAAARDGEVLATELSQQPYAVEQAAQRALGLLDAGREELARLRVDLLAHHAALLTRTEPPRRDGASARAEVDAAIARCWDWLCRNDARRELNRWAEAAPLAPGELPDPVRIVLPRGRDFSMLPFSLVLLGFTTAHASLAVGDIATATPLLLLPMAGFYSLFLIPGVLLLREAVRARRREELTLCGASVILRWQWWLWNCVETVVAAPDEPVRRDEVGQADSHPIHRLCLQGIDGRKLYFGFGLTEAQHTRIIEQMGRKSAPMLPATGEEQSENRVGNGAPPEEEQWQLPLF